MLMHKSEQDTSYMHYVVLISPYVQSVYRIRIFLFQVIASHIIKVHGSADAASVDIRASKEENWLKRYAHYKATQVYALRSVLLRF